RPSTTPSVTTRPTSGGACTARRWRVGQRSNLPAATAQELQRQGQAIQPIGRRGAMKFARRLAIFVGALALSIAPALGEYPEKPIRVIYPYAAGGAGDALARLFANAASPVLGQQLVVDNRPGAGGNIGFAAAAQAAPDGYTLLSVSPAFAINATLYGTPGY